MSKLDIEIIKQIPIVQERTKSRKKTAKELGISLPTVNKYLTIYKAAPDNYLENASKKKERVKVDEELEKKINERYAETKNMTVVARELNISNSVVYNHLKGENLKLRQQEYDDRDALFFYIYRLFGPVDDETPVSQWNLTQMTRFKNQGINYKAQLLTLKYFYEIEHHPIDKSNKSIGIIPFIVERVSLYYKNQQEKQKEIEAAIEKQLEQDRITIKFNPSDYIGRKKKKKDKKLIDLNKVVDSDDSN